MSEKHLFLVSYILDNQPQSTELESDKDSITPEEAQHYVEALHTSAQPSDITDVQVTRIVHPHEPGTTPGHYQQP